jgi:hypothetical protein
MTGLDETQRGVLERIIVSSRMALEHDLSSLLRGDYGIRSDGTIEDEDRLSDDSSLRERRRTLFEILDYLKRDGASRPDAVARLVREAAFTHVNRLVAIRIADALKVLSPSLRDGASSVGFKQVLELAPLLATIDDTGGYWTFLQLCADELARDVPALFDPRNPLLALRPSKPAIDRVIDLLSNPEQSEIWAADDTFGWAYQFFNLPVERSRDESQAPRDSRELAVRNQFFTPRYVVEFLVQNTLGRRLLDADPNSGLAAYLPHIVDPPTAVGDPLELNEVRVLDPACGSGHFLLGCYEVLEKAWSIQGVSPREAAPKIVPCLWGIDIDARCAQVAQAAVIFRARRVCGTDFLPPPNVVTARSLPDDETIWAAATTGLSALERDLVVEMRVALTDAKILGPLLKAEEQLDNEIRTTVPLADSSADDLFAAAGIALDAFGKAERAVIVALQRAADLAESSVADRLLAASAGDAIRFLEAIRHRYDAVLMNPPFGEPVPETKAYLKAAYPWVPTKDYNLYALFVGRGIELCRLNGYLGALTSRAGMFLPTFEAWRTQILLRHQIVTLADLGYGVMEQAMVEAAAYVVSPKLADDAMPGTYIRLLKDADRPRALSEVIAKTQRGEIDGRAFRIPRTAFSSIPGNRMAYWMGDSISRLFSDFPSLQDSGVEARQGLATGDDFRFLRLVWEVDPRRIAATRGDTASSKPWILFAKGGEYSPYWADIHLLLNWGDDGALLRKFSGARPQNTQYFFREGLTWPLRTRSGFGIRALPAGSAFGHKGPAVFSDADAYTAIGFLRSRLVQALLDAQLAAGEETTSGSAARSYEVGLVQKLPWPSGQVDLQALSNPARLLIKLAALSDRLDETTHRFAWQPPLASTVSAVALGAQRDLEDRALVMLEASFRIDESLLQAIDVDLAGRTYLDEEVGAHPLSYPERELDEAEVGRLLVAPMDAMIDELAAAVGGSRAITALGHVADRRLEVLSHAFQVHPRSIIELRRRLNVLPPRAVENVAARLISWLVGMAFGRWDVRSTVPDQDFDPFSPLPVCAPSMLCGADGFPVEMEPPGYPIALPQDRLLIDEPGHGLDLATAVENAARVAFDGGAELLADAVKALGRRTLQEYLAKQFFKDHLSVYSKSRRQGPLYWQLVIPSGGWSVWIYAPRLSREMLFALVRESDRRLAVAAARVRSLDSDPPITGQSARGVSKEIDFERTLIEQLGELRSDVARIAAIGWDPDIDDGLVLCAAPFSRWLPNSWKQSRDALADLRTGKYPWSIIHNYGGQL